MKTIVTIFLVLIWGFQAMGQEKFKPNYDESKVPEYTLPDPLVTENGTIVDSPEMWFKLRRQEIMSMFVTEMFGKTPENGNLSIRYELISETKDALSGKAIRREVRFFPLKDNDAFFLDLLIYTPKNQNSAVPTFLALNFQGNHAATLEPGIMSSVSMRQNTDYRGKTDEEITQEVEKLRGVQERRWPFETIIDRGYGVVMCCNFDIDPDFHDGFQNGIHPFYDKKAEKRGPDAWGTIAAWAWGLSRILDYLETDALVDAKRVAVFGHSRLGKTALWAGATDERFAMVISNNSGCGGAAISKRAFGETVGRINTAFPHWFCENFTKYNNNEAALPFDQHELIALIAPRPVYIASAEQDQWADPKGEFLAAIHADPVYRLLGTDGIASVTEMPPLNTSVGGTIHYHYRTGEHDVTDYDWDQYLDFADQHLRLGIK